MKHQPAMVRNWVQPSVKSLYGISGCMQPPCVPHQLVAKNVFRLKLLLLTCSILFFVFFWGLRGQILGALGSVYIALLVSWTPHMIQRWTWVRAWTRDAVEKWVLWIGSPCLLGCQVGILLAMCLHVPIAAGTYNWSSLQTYQLNTALIRLRILKDKTNPV